MNRFQFKILIEIVEVKVKKGIVETMPFFKIQYPMKNLFKKRF